jgi:hypothetical protein
VTFLFFAHDRLRSCFAKGKASAAALHSQPQPWTLHHDPHTVAMCEVKTLGRQGAGLRGRASCGALQSEPWWELRRPSWFGFGMVRITPERPTLACASISTVRPRASSRCSVPLYQEQALQGCAVLLRLEGAVGEATTYTESWRTLASRSNESCSMPQTPVERANMFQCGLWKWFFIVYRCSGSTEDRVSCSSPMSTFVVVLIGTPQFTAQLRVF